MSDINPFTAGPDELSIDRYREMYDEPEEDDDGCYECGGEGWIVDECFEDTCCCADPETQHRIISCPLCNPKGER